jgi:glycosyltransferase involved in cell wall biosynthesis
MNFIKVFCGNYPQHEFHIYGGPVSDEFLKLKKYKNCFFHGIFSNPDDLPKIYSELDLLLSTYGNSSENVRYAEPNKLYEAIYFEVPIIVSSGTFLSEKVEKLGIGYSINAQNDDEVINLIKNLTTESLQEKINNEMLIPKEDLIDKNDDFFNKLDNMLALIKNTHNE